MLSMVREETCVMDAAPSVAGASVGGASVGGASKATAALLRAQTTGDCSPPAGEMKRCPFLSCPKTESSPESVWRGRLASV